MSLPFFLVRRTYGNCPKGTGIANRTGANARAPRDRLTLLTLISTIAMLMHTATVMRWCGGITKGYRYGGGLIAPQTPHQLNSVQ
ncbi:hypothetical protein [Scytonema sp. PRP1]|uniref:hypothetical protein n=1 Tax=Scytonema sp. PRP1 TaxID=3120513 RepID=UPI002FD04B7E